jgi:hypothetical protein
MIRVSGRMQASGGAAEAAAPIELPAFLDVAA